MFQKIISPIIYALFIIPGLIAGMANVIFFDTRDDDLELIVGNLLAGMIILILIITSIAVVMTIGNIVIYKIERLKKPTKKDHIRQSLIFYLVLVLGILVTITAENTNGLGFTYLYIIMMAATIAIVTNIIYLVYKNYHGRTNYI
ncbi:MAG: hypothetical protein A3B74_04150 [Candidatus Kerfeldbacteria bacterium RIFCSPHIGHO2_02_FULL_42_14]|uniref:DUF2178 domain-containing protein n=1 Tax=Candidatus Kerfeldbacteria bacterium RIFCSPHIGHO2_02_FULL_42_14 TaxID=1798540 RepID=A0A1G2ARC5_9BACT|nr:MAG: hypothetical protein A3B74_04150 [Candidatus Kerfeldbacteria bacterium RIFCSPHIGHO2_02_FULL_42_14]OGY80699.1 MAG: hypothetical protein A3E60_04645 [Candidatus Kerfeldbacteria bacterium RIFCSPHIGHO2_12_FULL_42_13]OGY82626.1 MAG: hypothetical protein A3I91_04310 [Candidatus Kerfeldbacteria bacterium RIFCSPLOWO2_02_FULL_42_19]OGY85229.1 MAG: hypothetical protein A3G01_01440 [Candidatus Kerfeldbacteria bacterium RIFCSPLOWO2_12_FULL_43_9]